MSMMVIQHNMLAMNSNRMFGITTGKQAKSSEKLSSGYKINRAADDAAGLSISEKMRRQIRGLTQGVYNTQDGVSMCQIADGALNEVSDILHRITELSVKSANETNSDEDRAYIQEEIRQLRTEVDRISEITSFNEHLIFSDGTKGPKQNPSSGSAPFAYRLFISGTPVDDSIMSFAFSADSSGVSVNDTRFSYNDIKSASGDAINSMSDGTYTLEYNGLQFSFSISGCDDMQDVIDAINGTQATGKIHDNSKASISKISYAEFDPFYSTYDSISCDQATYEAGSYTLYADTTGISLEHKYNVTWEELGYSNTSSKISIHNLGGLKMGIELGADHSLEDIISELDGYTFTTSSTGKIVGHRYGHQIWDERVPNPVGGTTRMYRSGVLQWDAKTYDTTAPWSPTSSQKYDRTEFLASVISDLGYDPNKTYLYSNINGKHIFDPNDASNTRLSFSLDGKTSDVYLTEDSKQRLQNLINNGGVLQAGQSMTLTFSLNGESIEYRWAPDITTSLSEMADFYASKGVTVYFNGVYSERTVNIPDVDFSKRGLSGQGYSFSTQYDANVPVMPPKKDETGLKKWWIQSGSEKDVGMYLEIDNMNSEILGIKSLDVSTTSGAKLTNGALRARVTGV